MSNIFDCQKTWYSHPYFSAMFFQDTEDFNAYNIFLSFQSFHFSSPVRNLNSPALACKWISTLTLHILSHNSTISLYWGVFNILKITTTIHNDIVCISFNSKSAHSNPPIYIYMQKEDSLSFSMVLGSGGCKLSLLNKKCVGAKLLRLWFLWSFNVIWKLRSMWFEISVHNNSYAFFYDIKNYLMLWQAVISWSFYCDETWFTEVYCNSL